MTKILIAGVISGLVGGAAAVAAGKYVKPAPTTVAGEQPPAAVAGQSLVPPEVRTIGDAFMGKLKAGDIEGFASGTKVGMTVLTETDFVKFKKSLIDSRTLFAKMFGSPTGEFELVRETPAGPSLMRLIYLEKYERGGVLWVFVLFHTKDGWRLSTVTWNQDLSLVFGGLS